MRIAHNLSALNTLNRLKENSKNKTNSTEKISSGLRINKAADNAAGLAISQKMRAQIRGLSQTQRNIQDGISLIQTAEGALGEIQNSNLQRMRELTIQAANDTLTLMDRKKIQEEVEQIKKGINQIANDTEFNGIKLLNKSQNAAVATQTPAPEATPTNVPQLIWTEVPSGTTSGLSGAASHNGQFVVVGNNGTILTSNDGLSWISQTSGTTQSLQSVSWVGNKYIAVGVNGTILTSSNGVNWTNRNSNTTNMLFDIAWSGNQYVAVGGTVNARADGTVVTSPDGINWTSQILNVGQLREIEWDGSKFVAVGTLGTILTSNDGTNWTNQSSNTTDWITNLCWGGNLFLAGTNTGSVLASSDGVTWQYQSNLGAIGDIAWESNQFVVVGRNAVQTSNDGVNWISEPSGTTSFLTNAESNDSRLIAVGQNGKIVTANLNVPASTPISPSSPVTNTTEVSNTMNLQIGPNSNDNFELELPDVRTATLGIESISVNNQEEAEEAVDKVDKAINMISSERSKFGSYQNRLEHALNNASNYEMNLSAAESRISGTDIVKEAMTNAKTSILEQVGQAMLAQANQDPQTILQLLK